MKRKLIFLVAGLLFMVSAVQQVNAQPGSSDDGTATATILTPISITADAELEFGSIAAGSQESDVKISTAGARSLESGDATLYTSDAGQQGTFDVSGADNHTYSITLPSNGTVTLTGPGDPMAVKDFTSDPLGTGTLDGTGNQTINVGATLVVGAPQTAGSYTGTYTVTVDYN